MVRTLTLQYQLSKLGKITANLYPCSIMCYNFLSHFKRIERLKRIDHLGIIRKVYEGAHHSRWEYVMLQLGLLHYLNNKLIDSDGNKIKNRLGLSNKKNKFSFLDPSGTEILQIWILLMNSGHLPYTFSSERALLRAFLENENLKDTFLNGLPNNFKDYYEVTLEKEDVYSIHKNIIAFYIEFYKQRNHKIPPIRYGFLQEMLRLYIQPENKNQKLINTFKRIRQLSYLFLDSENSPFPINFDITNIFLNLDYYVKDIFEKPNSSIAKILDSFDNFLSINMYHSAETIREFGYHSNQIKQKIQTASLQNADQLYNFLVKDANFETKRRDWGKTPIFHLLLDVTQHTSDSLIAENFADLLSYNTEEIWKSEYNENALLTFHKSGNRKHMAINLSFCKESANNMGTIGRFIEDIIDVNMDLRDSIIYQLDNLVLDDGVEPVRLENNYIEAYKEGIPTIMDNIFEDPYQDIFLSILDYLMKPNLFSEFKDTFDNNVIPATSLHLDEVTNKIKNTQAMAYYHGYHPELLKSKRHELEVINETFTNLSRDLPKSFIALSEILIHDNINDIAEIDGLIIGSINNKLNIFLIEAKDQSNGDRLSLRALETKFNTLNFKTNKNPIYNTIRTTTAKGAYLNLEIDGQ